MNHLPIGPRRPSGKKAVALQGRSLFESAVKSAIRNLGEVLHSLGSERALQAACNRLEAMRPGQEPRRIDVLSEPLWRGLVGPFP